MGVMMPERYPLRWIVGTVLIAALLLSFVAGLRVGKIRAGLALAKAQVEIQKHQDAEDAHVAQEDRLKQDASDADARAVDAAKRAAAAERKLAQSAPWALPPADGNAMPAPVPTDVDLAPVVVQQREVIGDLKAQIGALTDEKKALSAALAASDAARKQSDLKADLQAQASKAASEGLQKARLLDRLETGGLAALGGFLIGRRH